jgi:hypothetical protein
MPPGIPVATVSLGKPGAINAGILAVQMLAIADPELREMLNAYKAELAEAWSARPRSLNKASDRIRRVEPNRPDPAAIAAAAERIREGGAVVFPTRGLYGLGADALNPSAVEGVFALKGRPDGKPLPVLVADMADLDRLVAEVSPAGRRLMARFWPGRLTLVMPGPARSAGGIDRRDREDRRSPVRTSDGPGPDSCGGRPDHRDERQCLRRPRLRPHRSAGSRAPGSGRSDSGRRSLGRGSGFHGAGYRRRPS